jgi:hypothetical protein
MRCFLCSLAGVLRYLSLLQPGFTRPEHETLQCIIRLVLVPYYPNAHLNLIPLVSVNCRILSERLLCEPDPTFAAGLLTEIFEASQQLCVILYRTWLQTRLEHIEILLGGATVGFCWRK